MKFIAIDWGSSAFRAYLIDHGGQITDSIETEQGVISQSAQMFEASLLGNCRAWLQRWPTIPVLMAGMIGSRAGWLEAPYLHCPVSASSLATGLLKVDNRSGLNLYLVPGVRGHSPGGSVDIIRGEEVQILGAMALTQQTKGLLCLPGTHSKWVKFDHQQIQNFATFFSGEMFALLKNHSSIGAVLDQQPNQPEDFRQGLELSRGSGGLLHHIFASRAQAMTGSDQGRSLSSYLSGIIIGHEFKQALALFPGTTITLVGSAQMQSLYQIAATAFGCQCTAIAAKHASIAGLNSLFDHHLSLPQEAPC